MTHHSRPKKKMTHHYCGMDKFHEGLIVEGFKLPKWKDLNYQKCN